jgi:hypothetical protein
MFFPTEEPLSLKVGLLGILTASFVRPSKLNTLAHQSLASCYGEGQLIDPFYQMSEDLVSLYFLHRNIYQFYLLPANQAHSLSNQIKDCAISQPGIPILLDGFQPLT